MNANASEVRSIFLAAVERSCPVLRLAQAGEVFGVPADAQK